MTVNPMSVPNPNSKNTAYVESFQGEGGLSANLSDALWYYSSQPGASALLPAALVSPARAATIAWQNYALGSAGQVNTFRSDEIDPNISLLGQVSTPEPLLWLTLYPLSVGGSRNSSGTFDWIVANTPSGRRWRSLRTSLSPSGADLTRVEQLEFWGLVDTSATGRASNPTVVIDLGDVSENSLVFSPDSLLVDESSGAFRAFRGKRLRPSCSAKPPCRTCSGAAETS
jgi:cell surface protein SprA